MLSEDPLLNKFDMSMDKNQSLMFVNDRKEEQEKMYFRDNYRFCIDILNNLLYDGRKYKTEAVPNYGINFEEKNGKIKYVRKQKNDIAALIQRTDGKIIQHEKVVRIGIWAGRFLLDPFVCYAALTHGGKKIDNLINNYLFNLLPEF